MADKQGGSIANKTGKGLEKFVQNLLVEQGYIEVKPSKFEQARYLDQLIFSRQYPLGKSIYDTDMKCDFILYHPTKFPASLIIETKWQQSGGSVDEKYPYLIANIKEKYPSEVILILDGGGYKKGAEQWVRRQVGDSLSHVFNMQEFQIWVNKGNI